ncbi:hypothetical protein PhaeoP57_02606 [Phaeobacter inhibens]|nr:hypothetical protein PhaeoP51_02644 [Phaeobacter inhibens]AUQ83507.1 hypothetical protein PhaeoP57_02606 [Phaeobacter inhibens]AUQ91267.1 hypothetical protein PhaeoP24_02677 [Phaeobacter inhibens]
MVWVCTLLRKYAGILVLLVFAVSMQPVIAMAQGDPRKVRLIAPQALIDTGVLGFMLPRFSLKTQVRVELVDTDATAEVALGQTGQPVMAGQGVIWHLELITPDHTGAQRFADWLTSDVGRRTLAAFAPDGTQMFQVPEQAAAQVEVVAWEGDAGLGYDLSKIHCGRCHAVDEGGRINSIGSTPSFYVLRSLADWEQRFQAFYALNPHPAFTQVAEVTPPFDEARPSPIVPVEITLDELENILAYVAVLSPADLGAPLEHK